MHLRRHFILKLAPADNLIDGIFYLQFAEVIKN